MYFDEDLILNLRFNILNEYVDNFIIVEATRDHAGNHKKLNFDIKKISTIFILCYIYSLSYNYTLNKNLFNWSIMYRIIILLNGFSYLKYIPTALLRLHRSFDCFG